MFGNASIDTVTRNALYLRGFFGIDAPVARGAARGLVRPAAVPPVQVHGNNGLGDAPLQDVPLPPPDPRPAHQLISDAVRAHPGEVTLIAVGRLTNLALALMHAPEIAGLIRRVVVMGGAFGRGGPNGNVTPVAEANFFGDPDAADLVLAADWPVTIVGLDVTYQVMLSSGEIAAMAASDDPAVAFLGAAKRHYAKYHRRYGMDGCYVHDSSAVICAVRPELFETRAGPVAVVTDGLAAGQAIQPRRDVSPPGWTSRPAQHVAIAVQADAVRSILFGVLGLNAVAGAG